MDVKPAVHDRRFEGKVAIVTGSGKGIGRAEAELLAKEGARVIVNDIGVEADGESRAASAVGDIVAAGGEAVASVDDIASFAGAEALVQRAIDEFGRLDVLINNAGLRALNRIDELTEAEYDRVLTSHLKGTFGTIKYGFPIFMRQESGVILNTGSEAGLGMAFNAAYSAAKEGIAGLTRTVARELGGSGARCNLLRPRAATSRPADYLESQERWNPPRLKMGRYALGERGDVRTESTAADVACLAVWLCSDAASELNGYDFQVSGNEVGLWQDPQLTRAVYRVGGWTLDALDEHAPATLISGLYDRFASFGA